MQINKIKINNIMGIEELEFNPGKFTLIEGKNGSGKTSVLEALKSVIKGGNDATLLRKGAEKGEVVFVLEDDSFIVKTVTEKKSSLEMFDRLGKKQTKAQSIMDTLADMMSVNPISFLTADKKTRTQILLELLPSELVPIAKLDALIKDFKVTINIDYNDTALEILEKYNNVVYDERTAINRIVKEKTATKNQMAESLVEISGDEEQIKAKLIELENKQYKLNDKKLEFQEQVLEWFEAEIKKLNEEKKSKMDTIEANYVSKVEPIKSEIMQLNEQLKLTASFSKSKEMVKQFTSEIEKLEIQSSDLTNAITEITNIKKSIMENLPFDNLQIIDGEIFRNEIPFDRLNEAEKVKIAVQIAKYKAGELGLICVDGIERLDTETFNEFKKTSNENELQLIVTKVSDNDFQIIND